VLNTQIAGDVANRSAGVKTTAQRLMALAAARAGAIVGRGCEEQLQSINHSG